jgi:ethanolamine utilization protein EutN
VKVARVSGTVVSTISYPFFDGKRLMICDLVDAEGGIDGYTIAVDVVDAGVGETVLVLDEGNSARQIFGLDTGPIRAVIVGIVDQADLEIPEVASDRE